MTKETLKIGGIEYPYIQSGTGEWEVHTPIGLYRMEVSPIMRELKDLYYLDDPTGEEGTWEKIDTGTTLTKEGTREWFLEAISKHITDNPVKEFNVVVSVSYANDYTVMATSDDHAEKLAMRIYDDNPGSADPASDDVSSYATEKKEE